MPASIVLSNLSYSTPDGRPLLSGLSLSLGPHRTGLIGRNGAGKSTLLKLISGELLPQSGTVAVACRVGVLHQSIGADPGPTIADLFGVADQLRQQRGAERGEAGAGLDGIDWSLEPRLNRALERLGLALDPFTQLSELSGGQATRARLAALAFDRPDFILLDEPTNNLDRDGRSAVLALLAKWRGGALIVSHDRELLDSMDAIVELTSLGATSHGGNLSTFRARKAIDLAAARKDLAQAERRIDQLARKAQAAQERNDRNDRAGRQKGRRGDIPALSLGLRRNASESSSGRLVRLGERRREQAIDDARQARNRIEILTPLSVELPSTDLPASRTMPDLDRISGGYRAGQPVIDRFSLQMVGPERVAIVGPNGCGKSTLLALITGRLPPWSGVVRLMTEFAMLDQRVSLLEPAATIRDNFRRINPGSDENACRAALARFMFRADAALQVVASLSGGQALRAGLACVLGAPRLPQLLILDEPTNHLDLESLETVEAGLRGYDGALLVVSHDAGFLDAIGISRRIELKPL